MFSLNKRILVPGTTVVLAAASLSTGVSVMTSPASAATDKVYVCKYVGQPGVDERLKAGKNPIEVATSSIDQNQWDGTVPGYFNDAHDRSYVLGYVGEIAQPSRSDCPGGDNPPEQIERPEAVYLTVCGPDNNTWVLPDDTNTLDWTISPDARSLKVEIKKPLVEDGVTFDDGTTEINFGIAPDFNEPCDPTEITAPTVPVNDPCGPDNAAYGNVPSGNYSVDRNPDGSITLTANEGYVFPDNQETYTYPAPVDSGKLCDDGEIGVAGSVDVDPDCESITIGTPTFSPANATATVTLNDELVKPGTHKVKAGEYVVDLFVNGENVGSERVTIKPCSNGNGGGNNGGNGGGVDDQDSGMETPAIAHTGR